ncbi:hypothetical protein BJ742DRAFT_770455 [Cladochytrium replicatum]|nr:hypothetical protein BJ742DRAFT_770455 [Cladochytrium replicatum]
MVIMEERYRGLLRDINHHKAEVVLAGRAAAVEAETSVVARVFPMDEFVCIVMTVICLLPDFLLLYLKRQLFPNDAHIISEQVAVAKKKREGTAAGEVAGGEKVNFAVDGYPGPQDRSFSAHALTTVFSYFGIYTDVIPISVFVTMELERLAPGRFMFWDKLMEAIWPENDWDPVAKQVKQKMKPSNTGLNKDLRAVEYVLSDKTGDADAERDEDDAVDDVTPTWIKVQATELLLALGLYHSVILSLDERTGNGNTVSVLSPRDEPLVNEQLAVLEFTSARKHWYRRLHGQDPIVDNIILERLSKDPAVNPPAYIEATNEALERFSMVGLRVLFIAMREIVLMSMHSVGRLEDREGRIDAVCATVERELQLVGATAIEHKLQNDVLEMIEYLLRANVTAIYIGISSKLIMGDMTVLILNTGSVGETVEREQQMLAEVDRGSNGSKVYASDQWVVFSTSPLLKDTSGRRSVFSRLIGKGKTTPTTTEPVVNATSKSGIPLDQLFLRLEQCHSVICCSVTPLQKSLVVKLVRKASEQGDACDRRRGERPVDDSRAAIRLGIIGRDCTQAVRASNYAFMEFWFLRQLLSKNLAFITVQWWFGFVSDWRRQTALRRSFSLRSIWCTPPSHSSGIYWNWLIHF